MIMKYVWSNFAILIYFDIFHSIIDGVRNLILHLKMITWCYFTNKGFWLNFRNCFRIELEIKVSSLILICTLLLSCLFKAKLTTKRLNLICLLNNHEIEETSYDHRESNFSIIVVFLNGFYIQFLKFNSTKEIFSQIFQIRLFPNYQPMLNTSSR